MNRQAITLDTPLAEIPWEDADLIGDDLIDTEVVGDEWGWAWHRVLRAGGTVRDLRDSLLLHSDLDPFDVERFRDAAVERAEDRDLGRADLW